MAVEQIILDFRAESGKFKQDLNQVTGSVTKLETATVKGANNATAAINKEEKAVERLNADMQKTATTAQSTTAKTTQSFNQMAGALSKVGAAVGVAFGVQQVIQFGKASVQAYAEAEKNAQVLLKALKGNESVQRRLLDFASEMQTKTIYDDDTIIQAETFLANQGRTEEQIKKTIQAAAELATVTGQDITTALQQLDMTFEGSAGRLGKLDGEFKKLSKTQLENGAAIDLVLQKYGGSAEALGDTQLGRIKKLENAWGDFQEKVGAEILPTISSLVDALSDLLDEDYEGFARKISVLGDSFSWLPNIYTAFEDLFSVIDGFQNIDGSLESFKELGLSIKDLAVNLNPLAFGINKLTGTLIDNNKVVDDSQDIFKRVANLTDEELAGAFEKFGKNSQYSKEEFDGLVQTIRDSQLDKVFSEIATQIALTEEQFTSLINIGNQFGIQQNLTAEEILRVRKASDEELDALYQRLSKTYGVTQEAWQQYVNTIKNAADVKNKDLETTTKQIGLYEALGKAVANANTILQDNAVLYEQGLITYDEFKERVLALEEAKQKLLRVDQLINAGLIENEEVLDEQNVLFDESIIKTKEKNDIDIQYADTVDLLNQRFQEQIDKSLEIDDTSERLLAFYSQLGTEIGNVFGALSNALKTFFGEAAEDNIAFQGFLKALAIAEITIQSAVAIANAVAKFSSSNPLDIISGIAGLISGITTLVGGLISQVEGAQTPAAPAFADGSPYVQLGNNPKGIDTIPAYLNEGEAVIPTDKNKQYPGLAAAWINGNLEDYIINSGMITPIIDDIRKQEQKDFATNIANSLGVSGGDFDDYRLFRTLKEGNNINGSGFNKVVKALEKGQRKRGGYA